MRVRAPDPIVSSWLVATAFWAAGCTHTQSAPTPASGMGVGTSASALSTPSTVAPWTNAAPSTPSASVESLTNPMDAAILLCTTALNLEPCGLITTGMSDMLGCFAACRVQIQTVATFRVERAALECASSAPPPDDAPRECHLGFPPGAAVDVEALGKSCDARCEELSLPPPQTVGP